MDFILPVHNNSFMLIIKDSCKDMEGVVTDHQCLPALCIEGALPLEGLGYSLVEDKNKCLQMMIYSVLGTKGTLGLPMINRNTSNRNRCYLLLI